MGVKQERTVPFFHVCCIIKFYSIKRSFFEAGKINIAAVGNRRTWRFKLPAELKNARQIYICLKDTATGYLQCVYPRSGP